MNMTREKLVPINGCWVLHSARNRLGRVVDRRQVASNLEMKVEWGPAEWDWVSLGELRSGFQPGWMVQDIPASSVRCPLGPGRVVAARELGEREQVLVQLDENGASLWLPYQNLKRIQDVQVRYQRARTAVPDHAERFRLRLLAHALENWNSMTGALDRLDVDPLPHQIQLVHRILSSANYNWLIADDVGLGKTIEVGLLLAALKRKNQARRVLIVTPAGLTRQWQDEMRVKFGQPYEIYGRDFLVNVPEHWKLHDHVIVSLDLAKRDEHMAVFASAEGWDAVIFDEGHKLTRYASGERAQRYRLAEALRQRTDALILLSGTPHQGYVDRFQSLLELVRPDLVDRLHTLAGNPEVVREMILRNRKSEVTDAEGNFIFHGTRVHRVAIEPSEATRHFQKLLLEYLTRGYKAGENDGAAGRAIGFVMTTYRKLASSSIAAIERALRLRLDRLSEKLISGQGSIDDQLSFDDLAEGGDDQDDLSSSLSTSSAHEFFAYEQEMIEGLLDAARAVRRNDEKLDRFISEVAAPIMREGQKLLVFTEYRATQTYLQEALRRTFSEAGDVELINGSMTLDEKLEAIARFNDGSRFMISTEAGGEGINLHRACHVMVNYDLPWNPARLVQRIGRIYRYGQKEVVIVFNLHARDSFDNSAISMMLDRVMTIAREMSPVGTEFNDRLYADILGDVLEHIDVNAILHAVPGTHQRTQAEIDEAIAQARRAMEMQDEIFRHVEGYAPDAMQGTFAFTMQHVHRFIRSMIPLIGGDITGARYNHQVLDIRLPESMRGTFPEFSGRLVVSVTTDRRLAETLRDVVLLDFESTFFRHLISRAKAYEFEGTYGIIVAPEPVQGTLAAFTLRWQNDQGDPVMEQFVTLHAPPRGEVIVNPPFLGKWLETPFASAPPDRIPHDQRSAVYAGFVDAANRLLAEQCSRFKHPNSVVHIAAADVVRQ